MQEYDIVAIGGGPAGLTVGLYGGRYGLKTLVLEKELVGGAMAISPLIENYPGLEPIKGMDLTERMKRQCQFYGAELRELTKVTTIDPDEKILTLSTGEKIKAKVIIFTTGSRARKLNVPGEEQYTGKGVSWCATCDGHFFRNKKVIIVGGGNSAAIEALHLAGIVGELYMVHRRDKLRAEEAYMKKIEEANINFYWNSIVKEIIGDGHKVTAVKLQNVKTDEITEVPVNGIFISIGYDPNSELAVESGIETDENSYIKVDLKMQTNIPGIYAAGDITGGQKQLTVSCGQATTATMNAFLYLHGGKWYL
ncbi:thioredoxin-disulfide reductase [Candidatus Heimdallarchaeota archaeon]|nr:MAG: thioredoxin-disulfide reductase [Candidatus Heimdallarchaeota archaeon]